MADRPLSILITRFPYESVLSGEEWHTITFAEKLRDRGHSVAFMGSCRILLDELAKRDFAVHKQPGGPVPVSSKKLLYRPAQREFTQSAGRGRTRSDGGHRVLGQCAFKGSAKSIA